MANKFLDKKIVDATKEFGLGYLDSSAKSASLVPYAIGMDDAAKKMYNLFDDRPQTLSGDAGAWLSDVHRNAGILVPATTAVIAEYPKLGEYMVAHPYKTVAGGTFLDGLLTEGFETGKAKVEEKARTNEDRARDATAALGSGAVDAARVASGKKPSVKGHVLSKFLWDLATDKLPKFAAYEGREAVDGAKDWFEEWYNRKMIQDIAENE